MGLGKRPRRASPKRGDYIMKSRKARKTPGPSRRKIKPRGIGSRSPPGPRRPGAERQAAAPKRNGEPQTAERRKAEEPRRPRAEGPKRQSSKRRSPRRTGPKKPLFFAQRHALGAKRQTPPWSWRGSAQFGAHPQASALYNAPALRQHCPWARRSANPARPKPSRPSPPRPNRPPSRAPPMQAQRPERERIQQGPRVQKRRAWPFGRGSAHRRLAPCAPLQRAARR